MEVSELGIPSIGARRGTAAKPDTYVPRGGRERPTLNHAGSKHLDGGDDGLEGCGCDGLRGWRFREAGRSGTVMLR